MKGLKKDLNFLSGFIKSYDSLSKDLIIMGKRSRTQINKEREGLLSIKKRLERSAPEDTQLNLM